MGRTFSKLLAVLKPKRRWFQYSLRSLLLFMVLASVLFAWLGWNVHRARLQRQEVAWLKEQAYVGYDFQYPSGFRCRSQAYGLDDLDVVAVSAVPQWLLDLAGADFFHNVVHVGVRRRYGYSKDNPNADDALLRRLHAFPNLRRLDLRHCGVTDQGLRYLPGLRHLEILNLSHTSVTDDGLPYIGKLKSLKEVDLSHNRVGGRGFHRLTPLQHLEVLCLTYTPVSDEAMKAVTALPRLWYVSVDGCTRLTPEGVAAFQRALPKCRLGGLPGLKLYWARQHAASGPVRTSGEARSSAEGETRFIP
jgi:hypothetical protein